MGCFVSKWEIEKNFHDWLGGFPEKTRFEQVVNWDFSYCVQTGKRDNSEIDNKQTVFTGLGNMVKPGKPNPENNRQYEKDVRQGNFGK